MHFAIKTWPMQDEESNWLEKIWDKVVNVTKVQDDDHWSIKLFKWGSLALIIGIAILLSPVIIVVLIFAFMISL